MPQAWSRRRVPTRPARQTLPDHGTAGLHPGMDHLGRVQIPVYAAGRRGCAAGHRDHRFDRAGRARGGAGAASRLDRVDPRVRADDRCAVPAGLAVRPRGGPARARRRGQAAGTPAAGAHHLRRRQETGVADARQAGRYPARGADRFPLVGPKSVGFVTRTFLDESGREVAAVYVPTTPIPTGGYLELVPTERLIATDWTMDQAMAFIVSGGAVGPDRLPDIEATQRAAQTRLERNPARVP